MKSQHLLFLPTLTTLVLGMVVIEGKSAVASDAMFHCQSNQAAFSTVAKTSSGAEQPIFHWKLDPATTSNTPEELCNSVTQKLNEYISAGNDLSSLTFKASTVFNDDEAMTSSPAVCVEGEGDPCKLPLFTLNPSDNLNAAGDALDLILDPALQSSAVKSQDRGFQSTSYKVNFWDLLGL